jgi:hypothetical protein
VHSDPHSYAMLYNSRTKPCGELPEFDLLCILTEAFYLSLLTVSDDKRAMFVEENIAFYMYTILMIWIYFRFLNRPRGLRL